MAVGHLGFLWVCAVPSVPDLVINPPRSWYTAESLGGQGVVCFCPAHSGSDLTHGARGVGHVVFLADLCRALAP